MRNLTKLERGQLEAMISANPIKRNGYFIFQKQINGERFRIKRSRALMQLYLDKRFEVWEIVHHRDGNKENDNISNLEIIDASKFDSHISIHHAGKRKNVKA